MTSSNTEGVVTATPSPLQKWIDMWAPTSGGTVYVPVVFNMARFLTIGAGGIQKRFLQAFLFTISSQRGNRAAVG